MNYYRIMPNYKGTFDAEDIGANNARDALLIYNRAKPPHARASFRQVRVLLPQASPPAVCKYEGPDEGSHEKPFDKRFR